jgi:hypothetical protein
VWRSRTLPAGQGTRRREAIRTDIPLPLQAPSVIAPPAHGQSRTPIRGMGIIAESRTRLDGRPGMRTSPRECETTEYGPSHRVLSGLTGPNGREATLVTCWQIEDRAGVSVPKLTTVWAQPHRDKESG